MTKVKNLKLFLVDRQEEDAFQQLVQTILVEPQQHNFLAFDQPPVSSVPIESTQPLQQPPVQAQQLTSSAGDQPSLHIEQPFQQHGTLPRPSIEEQENIIVDIFRNNYALAPYIEQAMAISLQFEDLEALSVSQTRIFMEEILKWSGETCRMIIRMLRRSIERSGYHLDLFI